MNPPRTKYNPNFNDLFGDAQVVLNKQVLTSNIIASGEGEIYSPEWLENWAKVWAYWGYRFTSIRYDESIEMARAKKAKSIFAAAGVKVSRLTANIREFILIYLSQSAVIASFHQIQGRSDSSWLLPEDILDAANHGHENELRDDFWTRCCMPRETKTKGQYSTSACNNIGSNLSLDVQAFLDFVVVSMNACRTDGRQFRNPFLPRSPYGTVLMPSSRDDSTNGSKKVDKLAFRYETPVGRTLDKSCSPEFDTNRAKMLICIGRTSGLPLQQAQLGVV